MILDQKHAMHNNYYKRKGKKKRIETVKVANCLNIEL